MNFTAILSKTAKLTLATLMAVSSLLVISITPAFAAVKTWTGAVNNNFNTAGNWSGSAVPQNGDSLTFDVTSLVADKTLTNDMTNLSLSGISFIGMNGASREYKIAGNELTISGSISTAQGQGSILANLKLSGPTTITDVASIGNFDGSTTIDTQGFALTVTSAGKVCAVGLNSALIGNGSLTTNGQVNLNKPSSSFTGSMTATTGTLSLRTPESAGQSSGITANNGATLYVGLSDSDRTLSVPVKIAGTGNNGTGALALTVKNAGYWCLGSSQVETVKTLTLSGGLELTGNAKITSYYANLKVTGPYVANGHTLSIGNASTGTISLPAGEVIAPVVEKKNYSDNTPEEYVAVDSNTVATVSGIYGDATVSDRGVLKGAGTVKTLVVSNGGTVSPGNSPGKLTILETLTLMANSAYEVELQNKDAYDQLQVGTDVDITDAKLDLKLFEGYKINKDDKFTIINKVGAGAITGTFSALAEGATLAVGTASFSISYVGGDGNDVVLTALTDATAPATPNTGFAFMQSSPVITLVFIAAAAGTLVLLARQQSAPVRSARKK